MGRLRRLLQPESEEESAGFADERPESNGLFGGHQSPHASRQSSTDARKKRLAFLAQKSFANEVDDVLSNVENDAREIDLISPGARRRRAFVDRGGLDPGRAYNLYKGMMTGEPE